MIVENKPEKRKKNPSNSGCKNCLTGSSISYAEAFLDVIALQQQLDSAIESDTPSENKNDQTE